MIYQYTIRRLLKQAKRNIPALRLLFLALWLVSLWCFRPDLSASENADRKKYWVFMKNGTSRMDLQKLQMLNIEPVVVSNWLKAVSAFLSEREIGILRTVPFIIRIQPVASFSIRPPEPTPFEKPFFMNDGKVHNVNYGTSLTQNELIRIPDVHDLGLTGQGIKIGMMDTGFDYRNRAVFSNLKVLGEKDFVFGDYNTVNETGEPGDEDDHGAQTLSVIAGYDEGQLIGPAYHAEFALAKTEWKPTETRIEEDYWVAGLEWLVDSMRVQIVSSSLGYNNFDDGSGYTYKDMNGNTCVTTIAADLAVKKGVTMVVSAGNEGNSQWHYILSPADGDSVIAAGAVSSNGVLAGFSSMGPTSDGRIKPDVVAMGVGVYTVSPSRSGKSSYLFANGTSFSCPLTAGVCALVLQAHPELNPMQIRDALRNTADRSQNPDTLYGWGLVNAYEAVFYHGPVFTGFQTLSLPLLNQEQFEMSIFTRNDLVLESAVFNYQISAGPLLKAVLVPVAGRSHMYRATLLNVGGWDQIRFYITAMDTRGNQFHGPIGAPEQMYAFDSSSDERWIAVKGSNPETFQFYPNYPNPFNSQTTITFDLSSPSDIDLTIVNVLGQTVAKLLQGPFEAGRKTILWDGKSTNGQNLPSGVYMCVLRIDQHMHVRKMTFLR